MQKQKKQDLSGKWNIYLDRRKDGFQKGLDKILWNEEQGKDGGMLVLPGILQAQGYGDEISYNTPWVSGLHDNMWYLREEYKGAQEGEVNIPFLSQPPKHYLGWAWYQKEVIITEEGQYQLFLECTRWKTTVWIDGEMKGSRVTLCSPHSYLLGKLERGKHLITILVDNEMQYPYRPDGHGVSDALAATWNGIVGEISLRKLPEIAVIENRIKWDIDTGRAAVELILQNLTEKERGAYIIVRKTGGDESGEFVSEQPSGIETVYQKTGGQQKADTIKIQCQLLPEERKALCIELCYPKQGMLWDEYQPNRKKLEILCQCGEEVQIIEEQFGFRQIEAREDGFFINGRPVYMRGTHFGGDFPLTGYPATEQEEWKRIFLICKKWGLNFMRFHSYCPPKAAFLAADEAGFYLQVECGMWNVFSEQEKEEPSMQEILWEETERILASFGNHPSFVMLSPSNEPGGDWLVPLSRWVKLCQKADNRRLYTVQSGWPYPVEPKHISGMDYVYFHRSGFGPYMGGNIRNKEGWFGKDYAPSLEGIRYPVICHEMGQWCSYPDFSIIEKFTGYMRPGNYKVFQAQAAKKGVLSQNKDFVYHSGRLQLAMYKEDFEANFRTPHLYGFEMLDLHDYLGQGSALVGVLDAFWDEKGYVKPEEFREFCNETVLLLRMPKYVFTKKEKLECRAEIAHFGRKEKETAIVSWRLLDAEGKVKKEEVLCEKRIPFGKNIPLGEICLSLEELDAPACYTIELVLEENAERKPVQEKLYPGKKGIRNHWNFWLYEEVRRIQETIRCREGEVQRIQKAQKMQQDNSACSTENKVCVLTDIRQAKEALRRGKTVLLSPQASSFSYKCPPLNPRPVFWNAQMGPRFSRGLGLLCDKNHPALSEFPTEGYEQWQWEGIMEEARGINLEYMNSKLKPIVQVIDDWNRSYKMALILEARVGRGKLLLTGCNLDREQEKYPQRAQLKKSLLDYAASEEFCPSVELSEEEAFSCFTDTLLLKKLEAECWIEELPQVDCSECISGNPGKAFMLEQVKFPLHLHIRWKQPIWIDGLTYLPIQNRRDHQGDIREYEIWVSGKNKDRIEWVQRKSGEFPSSFEPKEISFDRCRTDEVMLVIKSGFGCGYYQTWEEMPDGWRLKTGVFSDTSVSIGEVLVHSTEIVDAAVIDIRYQEGKTAALEIEE